MNRTRYKVEHWSKKYWDHCPVVEDIDSKERVDFFAACIMNGIKDVYDAKVGLVHVGFEPPSFFDNRFKCAPEEIWISSYNEEGKLISTINYKDWIGLELIS